MLSRSSHGAYRPSLVDRLQEELAGSGDAVVFCHNDVLLANVVIQEDNVNFIDLEYGAANYAAYDIANHFVLGARASWTT